MNIRILAVTALALSVGAASLTAAVAQTTPAPEANPAVAAAPSAWTADSLVAKYQAEGYTRIQIDMGTRWAEVEAIQGTSKVEHTYDLTTGEIVKSETSQVRTGENTAPGVFVRGDDNGHDNGSGHDGNGHGNNDHDGADGHDRSGEDRGHDDRNGHDD